MTLRMIPASGQTYTQILKSTMLMGGSSFVNVALSVNRNKALAVLLGQKAWGSWASTSQSSISRKRALVWDWAAAGSARSQGPPVSRESPALDLPWNDAQDRRLDEGFHHRREACPGYLLLDGGRGHTCARGLAWLFVSRSVRQGLAWLSLASTSGIVS